MTVNRLQTDKTVCFIQVLYVARSHGVNSPVPWPPHEAGYKITGRTLLQTLLLLLTSVNVTEFTNLFREQSPIYKSLRGSLWTGTKFCIYRRWLPKCKLLNSQLTFLTNPTALLMAGEAQYTAPRSQIISFWFESAKQTLRKIIYMDCCWEYYSLWVRGRTEY